MPGIIPVGMTSHAEILSADVRNFGAVVGEVRVAEGTHTGLPSCVVGPQDGVVLGRWRWSAVVGW